MLRFTLLTAAIAVLSFGNLQAQEEEVAKNVAETVEAIADEGVGKYGDRKEELGEELLSKIEREVMLQLIDTEWREHLTEMAQLREGINLRSIAQRDPLNEWQREGYDLFGEMMAKVDIDFVRYLMNAQVIGTEDEEVVEEVAEQAVPEKATAPQPEVTDIVESSSDAPVAEVDDGPAEPYIKDEWDKTPRNAPCPCGSGKKFKQCHGKPSGN